PDASPIFLQSRTVRLGAAATAYRIRRGSAGGRGMGDGRSERLWAPWRVNYVGTAKDAGGAGPCFICPWRAANAARDNLIVRRTERSVVVLNRYPYNNGHLLIAPRAHKGGLDELDADELLETMETLRHAVRLLTGLMKPDGFNVGLNLGRAAGAGLPGPRHWPLVPRWNGDTNFMPILADAKVIVQSLDALYDLLAVRFKS